MFRKLLKIFYGPSQEQRDEQRRLINNFAKTRRLPNRKDTEATPFSKEERAYGEKLADEIFNKEKNQ